MKKLITILTLTFAIQANAQCPFTISGNTVICAGNSTNLNASTSYTASGSVSYNWMPGGLNSNNVTVSPSATTIYTVTETAGTCTNVNTVTVTVNPGPTITASANPGSICAGSSATLTASGGSSYTWTPATTLSAATGSLVVATPNTTTTYTVAGPSGSCNAVLTLNVSNPAPFSITGNTHICVGNSTNLMTTITYTAGSISYNWMPGGLTSSNVTVSPSATTIYTVTGNAGGCTSIDTITVFVNSGSSITVSASPTTINSGGSATLTASGSSSYTWTPSSTLNTNTGSAVIANPCVSTTYTVSGASGSCSGVVTLNVNSPSVNYTLTPDIAPHTWDAYPTYSSNIDTALWNWGDGTTTWGLYPSHTYSVAGTYSICVIAYTPCGSSATACQNYAVSRLGNNSPNSTMVYVHVLNSHTAGIVQTINNNELNIYPNPTKGIVNVELGIVNESNILTITDMLGNTVKQIKVQNSQLTLDVSDLNDGVYNILIQNSQFTSNKRVVIVH